MSVPLHIAGVKAYGSAWSVMRPALVYLTTNARTTSSKELTPSEAEHMLERLRQTEPLWPRTPSSLHKWLDEERSRAEDISQ